MRNSILRVAIITEPHFGVDSRIKKDNVPDISDVSYN